MIAMTTSSSIKVKPDLRSQEDFTEGNEDNEEDGALTEEWRRAPQVVAHLADARI